MSLFLNNWRHMTQIHVTGSQENFPGKVFKEKTKTFETYGYQVQASKVLKLLNLL